MCCKKIADPCPKAVEDYTRSSVMPVKAAAPVYASLVKGPFALQRGRPLSHLIPDKQAEKKAKKEKEKEEEEQGDAVKQGESYAMMFWVLPKSTAKPLSSLVSTAKTKDSKAPAIFFEPGKTSLKIRAGVNGDVSPHEELPINGWTHVAVLHDGDRLRVFLDGHEAEDKRVGPAAMDHSAPVTASDPWHVPAHVGMEDLRFYDRIPTLDEVRIAAHERPSEADKRRAEEEEKQTEEDDDDEEDAEGKKKKKKGKKGKKKGWGRKKEKKEKKEKDDEDNDDNDDDNKKDKKGGGRGRRLRKLTARKPGKHKDKKERKPSRDRRRKENKKRRNK